MGMTSVRMPDELLAQLEQAAAKRRRSKGWLINDAVKEYLEREAQETQVLEETRQALADVQPPKHMTGRIFLGDEAEAPPSSVYLFSGRFDEAPDNSRAVTDGRWKYIRNFESDRPLFQMLNYPLRQAGQISQWEAYRSGMTFPLQAAHYQCQPPEKLYDTLNDPHEVRNLARSEPGMLETMRARLRSHVLETGDLGFIPEPMMEAIDASGGETIYSFGQSEANYPLARIFDLATLASARDPANRPAFVKALQDKNPIIRYWGMLGLRMPWVAQGGMDGLVEKALVDPAPSVRVQAAIYLGRSGQRERALDFLLREALSAEGDIHSAWALDAIKLLDGPEALASLSKAQVEALAGKGFNSKRLVNLLKAGGSVSRMPSNP